jgi:DNA-binding MarR family transcriptional regulator
MAARDLSPPPTALRDWLQLVLQVGTVARAARRQLAAQVASSELSEQEFLVLWLCGDASFTQRGQCELADAVGVSPAQMSGLVDRLRRRNLLQFERLGRDRRRQVWQLTTAGQTLLNDVCALLAAAKLQGELNNAEQLLLLSLLERSLPASDNHDDTETATMKLRTPDLGGPSSCAA